MKLAITGDWHVDEYSSAVDPESGLNRRLVDYLRTAGWVAAEARRRGCEALVICGDLSERRHPSPWLVARIGEAIALGPDRVILALGNHDGSRGGRSIVDVFDAIPGWTGVSRPQIVRVGALALCCIPYLDRHHLRAQPGFEHVPDADVFRVLGEQYLTIARGLFVEAMAGGASSAILVGHQTLSGGRMSESQQAFLGDLSLVVDARALQAIGYQLVAFGHLHRAQTVLDDPVCPVVYPGSIEMVDFGEEGESKSFLVVDADEAGLLPVALERVETPARRFVTLDSFIGDTDVDGAIVRLLNVAPEADTATLRRSLEAAGAFEITSITQRRSDAPAIAGGLSESLGPLEALAAYFADDPDAEALVALGRELLEAAA